MSASSGSARRDEGSSPSYGTGGDARNPAQASLSALEPIADAAMTYFYGQLFAMDNEIRAMFPAAMDVQRKRFFRALVRIAEDRDDPVIPAVSDESAPDGVMHGTVPELAARATWADRDIYISGPDAMITKTVQVLRERGAPNHLIRYDLGGLAD